MKRIFILGALCVLSSSIYGQMSWGVKGGINFNKIVFKNLPDGWEPYAEISTGFHLGIWGDLPIGKKFSLSTALQFSQRGASVSDDYRINLNYIEVPILVSFSPIKKLSFDFGPDVAFKLSAFAKSDDAKNKLDHYNAIDFGLCAGARFNITDKISIIGRYYHGLISVDEITYLLSPEPGAGYETAEGYNRSAQLGLSYQFSSAK